MLSRFTGSIVSYLIVGAISAAAFGLPVATMSHSMGYGKASKERQKERVMFFTRELSLWHENGACRVTKMDIIDKFDEAWTITGEAKAQMQAELRAVKQREKGVANAAALAIKRLEELESQSSTVWKNTLIPPDAVAAISVCDAGAPCPDTSPGSGGSDDMAVREPPAGNGDGL